MWDIPRLYVSACSNSVQLVPLHPIFISILFHHYKELKECVSEVERIEEEASSRAIDSSTKKIDWLRIKEEKGAEDQEEQKEKILPTILDGYFLFRAT
jgi:hypothetical protein